MRGLTSMTHSPTSWMLKKWSRPSSATIVPATSSSHGSSRAWKYMASPARIASRVFACPSATRPSCAMPSIVRSMPVASSITELLVMELATGIERTIGGIAHEGRVALGHAKTREAMRAGLAMYFQALDDPWLEDVAGTIVAELGLDHFFNIQLVGECVIEVNPRISTIVYQEDLNLPWLGVKHALGEISEEELAALRPRMRPTRRALRYFDQVEWDE